jgi:hypothetical protein
METNWTIVFFYVQNKNNKISHYLCFQYDITAKSDKQASMVFIEDYPNFAEAKLINYDPLKDKCFFPED